MGTVAINGGGEWLAFGAAPLGVLTQNTEAYHNMRFRGTWQGGRAKAMMAKELANIITPDGRINPDFDLEKMDQILSTLMGDDASEVTRLLKAMDQIERLLDPRSGSPDIKGLMDLTKEMLGSDPETRELLDAAEPLLRHLLK